MCEKVGQNLVGRPCVKRCQNLVGYNSVHSDNQSSLHCAVMSLLSLTILDVKMQVVGKAVKDIGPTRPIWMASKLCNILSVASF